MPRLHVFTVKSVLALVGAAGLPATAHCRPPTSSACPVVTPGAARAFGYEKDPGSLEACKPADLILVSGEPLRDIKDAAKVQQVMVDGRLCSIPELIAPFAAE